MNLLDVQGRKTLSALGKGHTVAASIFNVGALPPPAGKAPTLFMCPFFVRFFLSIMWVIFFFFIFL